MSLSRSVRWLLFAALGLQLTVSANILYLAGIDYAHPGGNPVGKFHPATYLLALATFLAWRGRPPHGTGERAPAELRLFLIAMFAAMVWSTVFVGPSGVAVYVESYVVAGLFAVLVHRLDDAARLRLARFALLLVAANVVLALGETFAHAHLVPIYLQEIPMVDAPGEFRPSALYDHPLARELGRPSQLAGTVDHLESSGVDSLWFSELVYSPAVDPVVGMAYALARTEHLKVGTSVAVLPGRPPVLVAKQLA